MTGHISCAHIGTQFAQTNLSQRVKDVSGQTDLLARGIVVSVTFSMARSWMVLFMVCVLIFAFFKEIS